MSSYAFWWLMLASPSVTFIILWVYTCGYLHSSITQSTCSAVILPQFFGNQQNTVIYQVSILLPDSAYHIRNGDNQISLNNITIQTDCRVTILVSMNKMQTLMAWQSYLDEWKYLHWFKNYSCKNYETQKDKFNFTAITIMHHIF